MKTNEKSNRNKNILEVYKQGHTFEEIGTVFGITRSRVQQIVFKEMEKEILNRVQIAYPSYEDRKLAKLAAHEEIKEIFSKRAQQELADKKKRILAKIQPLIDDYDGKVYIGTIIKASGIAAPMFKSYFPEIAKKLSSVRNSMWSKDHARCLNCGTNKIKHQANGLCENCYPKSEKVKAGQKAYVQRNIEILKIKQREYAKEYIKRPEVVAKMRRWNDQVNYGGNREKALERDGYKCQNCGITQEESFKKYGRDLYVEHVRGKSNELSNLITACEGCHYKTLKRKQVEHE